MSWSAIAPSNLALIKYMGKVPHACNQVKDPLVDKSFYLKQQTLNKKNLQAKAESTFSQYLQIPIELSNHLSKTEEEKFWLKNMPLNASLSYTLKHFITKVSIKEASTDCWSPFKKNIFQQKALYHTSKPIDLDMEISKEEQKRFLDFFQFLKNFFLIPGNYQISSLNNFPKSGGLASSASSFCALTIATYKLAQERSDLPNKKMNLIKAKELAHLSRVGSGSACRSLFSPWCIWNQYKIHSFKCSWNQLDHQLILIDKSRKKINSTLAHQRIQTSKKFTHRPDRAQERMALLKASLNLSDWKACFKTIREEFLDMHSLFENSEPPFSYQTTKGQEVLNFIDDFWKIQGDGPLVTMDAGPNIHLLYRKDQENYKKHISKQLENFTILSSF